MYQEIIKNKMFEALKAKDKKAKDAYAILFDALKKKEVDIRRPLTEVEEIEIIAKVVKQCKDTIASVPEGQGGASVENSPSLLLLLLAVPRTSRRQAPFLHRRRGHPLNAPEARASFHRRAD